MSEQQPIVEGTTDVLHELEKVAEGFESRDFHYVTLCLKKILETLEPEQPHAVPDDVPSDALSTSPHDEARKTIKALDRKEYSLAAICLRKAAKGYAAGPVPSNIVVNDAASLKAAVDEAIHYLTNQEFSTVATCVRRAAKALRLPTGHAVGEGITFDAE